VKEWACGASGIGSLLVVSQTVSEWSTSSLKTVSASMGYTIPEIGKTVLLIVHQGISLPHLGHNLLSTMQMILHDVVVNETPKFQCLEATQLSHTISVSSDNVDEVLIIPLDLKGVVSCFTTFKPSQDEFNTCDRYELTFESPEYYPTVTSFVQQEAGMIDAWGRLKVPGDSHPRKRKVCSLRQKEMEMSHLGVTCSNTNAKVARLILCSG
jgi:hypothetical protein